MIHFDMNPKESGNIYYKELNKTYLQLNQEIICRYKNELEEGQKHNRWPVIISLGKRNSLREEYPLNPPSTGHKK